MQVRSPLSQRASSAGLVRVTAGGAQVPLPESGAKPLAEPQGADPQDPRQRAWQRFQQLNSGLPKPSAAIAHFDELASQAPPSSAGRPAQGSGQAGAPHPATVSTAQATHAALLRNPARSAAYTVWSAGSLGRCLGPSGGPEVSAAFGVFCALCSLYEAYATQCDRDHAHEVLQVLGQLHQAEQGHWLELKQRRGPRCPQQALALELTRINLSLLTRSIVSFEQRLLSPQERARREEGRSLRLKAMRLRRLMFRLEQRRVQHWRLQENAKAQAVERRVVTLQARWCTIDQRLCELGRTPDGLARCVAAGSLSEPFGQLSDADVKLLRDARLQLLRALVDTGAGLCSVLIGVMGPLAELVDSWAGLGLVSAAVNAAMALLDREDAQRSLRTAQRRKQEDGQALVRAQACLVAYGEDQSPEGVAASRVLRVYQQQWASRFQDDHRRAKQEQIRDIKAMVSLPVATVAAGTSVAVMAGTGGTAAIPVGVAAGAVGAVYYGSNAELWARRLRSESAAGERWAVCQLALPRRTPLQWRQLMMSPAEHPDWQALSTELLASLGQDGSPALRRRLRARALADNVYLVIHWLVWELDQQASQAREAGARRDGLACSVLRDLGMSEDLLDYLLAAQTLAGSAAEHQQRLREILWEFFAARPQSEDGLPAQAVEQVVRLEGESPSSSAESVDEYEAVRDEAPRPPERRPRHNDELLRLQGAMKKAGVLWRQQSPRSQKGRALMHPRLPIERWLPNPLATPGRASRLLDGLSAGERARCCTLILSQMLQDWPVDETTGQRLKPDGLPPGDDEAGLLRHTLLNARAGCGHTAGAARASPGFASQGLAERASDFGALIDQLIRHIDASRMQGRCWWLAVAASGQKALRV